MTTYADIESIAALLGLTLTSSQEARAEAAADAASDFIERALDRSWLESGGLVEDERHTVRANRIWLKHPPAVDDETLLLSVRSKLPGATTYAQTQPYQWELLDPDLGHIYTSPTLERQLAIVTYTSTETIPPLIAEVATELAAGMLALALAGAAGATAAVSGVRRYTLWGGDLSVEYASTANAQDGAAPGSVRLPALWADVERLYGRRLAVA